MLQTTWAFVQVIAPPIYLGRPSRYEEKRPLCRLCHRFPRHSVVCSNDHHQKPSPRPLYKHADSQSRLAIQQFGSRTLEILKDLEIPDVWLDYHKPLYNETKVALLIENRPDGKLAPMILHMMSVVPPDWKFRFMGSNESVALVNNSAAIQRQVAVGKLDLTYIPSNMSVIGGEAISQFLTTLWLYDTVLQPAEHLLVFQTDSTTNPIPLSHPILFHTILFNSF